MTLDKVKGLIAEQLCISVDEISEDSDFIKDLNADSIDLVEMIMTLEDEFGITIPDEKAGEIKTVKDIVKFIEESK